MKKVFVVIALMFFYISTAESYHTDWSAPDEFSDVKNPFAADQKSLEKGKAVYFKQCVKCHGDEGKANGVSAGSLQIELPDFSKGDVMGLDSDGELFFKITTGNFEMPPFQLILSNKEIWHVINFVRSLAK